MLSFSMEDISTFNEYRKEFKLVVSQYNKRYQESIKSSPRNYLNKFYTLGLVSNIIHIFIDIYIYLFIYYIDYY